MTDASTNSTSTPEPSTDEVAFRYVREGSYTWGVPARDLTNADYADLPPDLQREVLFGGFYKDVRKPAKGAKTDTP